MTFSTSSRQRVLKNSLIPGLCLLGNHSLLAETQALKTPHFKARAKRVIFLCMKGGPSHLDLYDPKPELIRRGGQSGLQAPPYGFIRGGKSGLEMSELLPKLAKRVDDLCLIRSMETDLPNHAQAFGQLHTGSFQFTRPSLGAWVLYGLGTENPNLPGFITLNPPSDFGGARNYGHVFLPSSCQGTKLGGGQLPALYAALLKKETEPGPPLKFIESPRWSKQEQRNIIDLIKELDLENLKRSGPNPEIEGSISSFDLAFRMQKEVPQVLDLEQEPVSTQKLYGINGSRKRNQFARQCLLARRLIETGVRFVEVTAPVNWDQHRDLKNKLAENCEVIDHPIAGLLEDLSLRGLLKDTLVVWAGEFGRTPYSLGENGREHNNKGYTVWMAGGGIKGGISHGETDELGAKAVIDKVHLHDLHATILACLGLDHQKLTYEYGGRNFRLTNIYGEVVKPILT